MQFVSFHALDVTPSQILGMQDIEVRAWSGHMQSQCKHRIVHTTSKFLLYIDFRIKTINKGSELMGWSRYTHSVYLLSHTLQSSSSRT